MDFKHLLQQIFHEESKPETPKKPARQPGESDDGWIELRDGSLTAHDPFAAGRFPSLAAEGSVRLWVNGEPVDGVAVVCAADAIRFEVDTDLAGFFTVSVADDEMTATLHVIANPVKLPDTVTVSGQHPAHIVPGYSAKAHQRGGDPMQMVRAAMERLNVVYGIDEEAIRRELAAFTGRPVVVARGQQPAPTQLGKWNWRVDQLGLVEPGQVIGFYQGSTESVPRITVTGVSTPAPEIEEPGRVTAGAGTRIMAGGRMVSLLSGRARTSAGGRIDVFAARVVEGDLTGELEIEGDLVVKGHLRDAKVRCTGQLLVQGHAERSEAHAAGIAIRGEAAQCRLYAPAPGIWAPLGAELSWLMRRVSDVGDLMMQERSVKEKAVRDLWSAVHSMREKAVDIGVTAPDFMGVLTALSKDLMRPETVTSFSLAKAESIRDDLSALASTAATELEGGDVVARSLSHCKVWASRNIAVEDKAHGCTLLAGGNVSTAPAGTIVQTEIVAGGEVKAGTLASIRSTAPVFVRAPKVEAQEVQPGCTFEFVSEQKLVKTELRRVSVGVTVRGQVVIRQS